MDDLTHFIKYRKVGARSFWFLTPEAKGTNRRVYAAQYPKARAEAAVDVLTKDNPGFEFKIVPISGRH